MSSLTTANPPENRDENRDPKITFLVGVGIGVASPINSSPPPSRSPLLRSAVWWRRQ
ncbi:hypothetical protein TIFTF001_053290 [Ficus carica]|uniref:Uncharacterized protein n=1 Tax=Ficus carica TaxID=3494 RepID=A0AA88EHS4_FICCA|nr:hypothetical protein TIFTF001_053290 [Ficus carica]